MKEIKLNDLKRKLRQKKFSLPIEALVEVTTRCNLDCDFCYQKGRKEDNLNISTDKLLNTIDQLEKAGCMNIKILGGEPFIREDFLDIYAYIRRKGFLVTIFTNGTLITDEISKFLFKYPPYSIKISMYAGSEEKYKKITGKNNVFNKVISCMEKFKEYNIPFYIFMLLYHENFDEVGKVKKIAENLEVPLKVGGALYCDDSLNGRVHRLTKLDKKKLRGNYPELYKFLIREEENINEKCRGCLYINTNNELIICPMLQDEERYRLDRVSFYKVWSKRVRKKIKINCPCK